MTRRPPKPKQLDPADLCDRCGRHHMLCECGEQLKEEGQDRVERNGESFVAYMRDIARGRVRCFGRVTVDDLRHHAWLHNLKPHHRNAWGAIFRGKEWKAIGFKRSTWPDSHARMVRVWRLAR